MEIIVNSALFLLAFIEDPEKIEVHFPGCGTIASAQVTGWMHVPGDDPLLRLAQINVNLKRVADEKRKPMHLRLCCAPKELTEVPGWQAQS